MQADTGLSARAGEILHSIVKAYIETGGPVPSLAISRLRQHRLSPATVRNVMAELADAGYLHQPHTSAGRVPTRRAFRYFVGSLAARRLPPEEADHIRGELRDATTTHERIERCSHMLTELTSSVGIAAAIPAAQQVLDCVELVALGDRRVLMIVVMQDKSVCDRVITLNQPVSQDELTSVRNYLNAHFSGWIISDARRELERRLEQASAAYDAILRRLLLLSSKGLLDVGVSPDVHMEGTANLVVSDLHLTRERLRELFQALEEKRIILQLLERFLEHPSGELEVRVGLDEEHPSMEELSLVGLSISLPGGGSAKIAVLGPMRMNYERAMSAVFQMGRALGNLPS